MKLLVSLGFLVKEMGWPFEVKDNLGIEKSETTIPKELSQSTPR